jgi:hypothetical protein
MTSISGNQPQTQMSTDDTPLTRESLADLQAQLPDDSDSDRNSAASVFSRDPDPTRPGSPCTAYSDNGDAVIDPAEPVQPPAVQNGSNHARSYLPDTPNASAVLSRRAGMGLRWARQVESQATYPAHDTVRIRGGWGNRF